LWLYIHNLYYVRILPRAFVRSLATSIFITLAFATKKFWQFTA
jgi:hypothetical protein